VTWVRAVCRQLGVRVHRYMEKFVSYDAGLDGAAGTQDLDAASDILEELFDGAGTDGAMVAGHRIVRTPDGSHVDV
jgi:hypothetical protein